MSNYIRKIKRNILKNQIGSNKIKEAYHDKYDTIEKIERRVKKENETRRSKKP